MEIIQIVKDEFHKRMIEEGFSRIEKCLKFFTEDEIWTKHNKSSNSLGNLLLHLSGNVRQYVISGIAKQEDVRERDKEFNIENRVDSKQALADLKACLLEANNVVKALDETELTEPRTVQGFEHSCLSIIIHVVEHFSYHVGQVTYYTKLVKDMDTGYYEGLDLNIRSKN